MMRRLVTCVLLGLTLVAGGPARAQMESREGIALQNQILELRRDLQVLREQLARGGPVPYRPPAPPVPLPGGGGEMLGQLLARVAALEEQVRALTGRQDELANTLQRQNDELGKQVGDLGFRLQALESGGRSGGAAPATSAAPADPGRAVPPARVARTPEAMMQEGNAALARRDYATAEAMAREVLALRGSPRAYDAQFLLAQAMAGKREHAQAAIAYDDTYKRARTGRHAQDALLGLANALAALNERRSACDTLNTLRAEFPNPRPEVRDAAASLRQRAGCR